MFESLFFNHVLDMLEHLVSHKITQGVSGDHVTSALVPRVNSAAATSETRLLSATGHRQFLITVTEYKNLPKSIGANVSTPDSNLKMMKLSFGLLQAHARPDIQEINKQKATVLADNVTKAYNKESNNVSSIKNSFSRWCMIPFNSGKVFYNHNQFGSHLCAVLNQKADLNWSICKKEYHSATDLATPKHSSAHIQVARGSSRKPY